MKEFVRQVLRPKSPILISPDWRLMKMLSHLISRWIMGGSSSCKYFKPLRMYLHHFLMTLSLGFLYFERYCLKEPPVTISVMKTTSSFSRLCQAAMKWTILMCLRPLIIWISFEICAFTLFEPVLLGSDLNYMTFHATSFPVSSSIPLYTVL